MIQDAAGVPTPPSLPPGYRLVRHLASGGMAEVYVVTHVALGSPRALKIIGHSIAQDDEFVRRFEREQRTAERLADGHRSIIRVYDFGRLPSGQPFAVLPYYEAGSLDSLGVAPTRASGISALCAILADVASALVWLSTQKPNPFVHRDLKPGNILIGETNGRPYGVLADFGLARAVADASITGPQNRLLTPAYAAPEQFRGEPLEPRADVYALALTACQMFYGRLPFRVSNEDGWEAAHLHGTPRLSTPTDRRLSPVAGLIRRSLEKEPDARPYAREWERTLRAAQLALAQ